MATQEPDPSFATFIQETMLPAMDGVAYLVDAGGQVIATGRSCVYEGYGEYGDLVLGTWVGDSLFDAILSEEVRAIARRLHRAVAVGRRNAIFYEYRCDEPTIRRHMRMSLNRLEHQGRLLGVLYQSVTLSEATRAAIDILDMTRLRDAEEPDGFEGPLLRICSYCHDVAWPAGAQSAEAWIAPEEYYRRGGRSDVATTHGVCPSCAARLHAETLTLKTPPSEMEDRPSPAEV